MLSLCCRYIQYTAILFLFFHVLFSYLYSIPLLYLSVCLCVYVKHVNQLYCMAYRAPLFRSLPVLCFVVIPFRCSAARKLALEVAHFGYVQQ